MGGYDRSNRAGNVPGKGSVVEPALGPGKRTLTEGLYPMTPGLRSPSVFKTGNTLVDEGLGCADKELGTKDCLLSPQQRATMLPTYQSRVNAAYSAYITALQVLRVEELMKKQDNKGEWVFELFLDIISTLAIGTALKVFSALKGGATEGVAHLVDEAGKITHAMADTSAEQVSTVLGMAIGQGKKKASDAIAKKAADGTPQSANVAFLDHLTTRAAGIYEVMREDMIAGVSDTMLLVLFESFRAVNGHTVAAYKEAIARKLTRFEQSGIGHLGVTRNEDYRPVGSGIDAAFKLETKVFWVQTPVGKRLGLYTRGHDPVPDTKAATFGWQDTTAEDKRAYEQRSLEQHPFRFVNFVADEFIDAALALHKAKWNAQPTEQLAGPHEYMQMGAP